MEDLSLELVDSRERSNLNPEELKICYDLYCGPHLVAYETEILAVFDIED